MLKFLKTTVLGGIVFLVPLVIFIVVLGKAVILVNQLATPIAATFPAESVGGLAVVHIVALLLLVFICFLAGLAARTPAAARLVESLEANVLDKIPAYALMKAKAGSVLSVEDAEGMVPILIQFDDSWQLGFEVEKLKDDRSLVFLPGAPDPWSGSVCVVTGDRVSKLDASVGAVAAMMKRLGKGSSELLETDAGG